MGTSDRRLATASVPPRLRRAAGALCLAALAAAAAGAQVVINEVDYDQASTDTAEFVELKNTGLVSEDLGTYTLELVNGNGGGAAVYDTIALPSVNLAPGDYFVVCANAATVANCDLDDGPDTNFIQNGAPDAVGLRQAGVLVDALSYEGNTGAPYTEGSGSGLVDDANGDTGLSRCPDGADSDHNALDFVLTAITPGAANTCPGPMVVINEIDYDQPGTDAAEFIELKNVGPAPVDLSAMTLELVNGSGGGAAVYDTIALPAVALAPGDYFVVCANAATVANCDLDDGPDTNFVQNGSPDAVALRLGAAVLDTVSYEGDTAPPYTEGSGSGLEDPGGSGDDDLGISRFPDGVDTDVNNVDFSLRCITPGAPNTAADSGCGVVEPVALVLNEIDYDQPGTDTMEFVEIKNVGAGTVDLGTVTLELVNGAGGGAAVYASIALPSVSLAPGEYFVVCADAATVANCDLDESPDSNFVQNGSPDAVALWLGATLLDAVSYEGDTAAPYTEGSGVGLEDPAGDNLGISRFPDGVDTDANNVDWSARCITPGAANTAASANCPAPGPPALVVNEIDYDQPGTDGAEFVEIKNVGNGAADLTGVELVLVNGNGGGAVVYDTIALPATTLAAGDYFVVCANAATVAACDLDEMPDTNFLQNGAPDAVALVFGGLLLDAVSYEGDTGAPYTEGSGAGLEDDGSAPNFGLSRFPDGIDTDANDLDLSGRCITPGSANTALVGGCTGTGGAAEIFEIQGSGAASPFAGQTVTTFDNVVTAVRADGFFLQTPAARDDGDPDTSNGIFVFTGAAPAVAVGDHVDVSGPVVEFFDFTEFTSGSTVTVLSSGNPLPPAVVFDAATPSPDPTAPSCALEFECYEGMRITVADGVVGAANQRFGTDPIAEVFVSAGGARAFREPGVEYPGLPVPTIPVWDGNPEVFELDPDKMGLANQIIPAGSTFSAEGVLGYEFGGYELWPTALTVNAAPLPVAVRDRADDELTIGSLNMFRFFDDVDDPPSANANGEVIRDDTVVSTAEYLRRRDKFVVHILDVLGAPDILGVQEVEKLEVLQDLAADIAAVEPTVQYTAYLVEGNDVGTIDVGFLVRDTVAVDAVSQHGYGEIFTFDGSLLNDRPPLLLTGRYVAGGVDSPIAVLVVHSRSLGGIDDPVDGDRVRRKRLDQAQSVAQLVQDLQTADPGLALAVIGDFNAFEFTDGYVDVVGQMKGSFDPAANLLSGPDLVDPDLTDEVLSLPAGERYSFVFGGSAQVLDHALTTAGLAPRVRGFAFGRGNADAAEDLIFDGTTPAHLALRSSDHDGFVLYVSTDSDGDGVPDGPDVCADTVIPEGVPTVRLGVLRWALVDDDTTFDTILPWGGLGFRFTTEDTAGCSCEQIIEHLHLGQGHVKFGCSTGAMLVWYSIVHHP